jgi:hypothetical protein
VTDAEYAAWKAKRDGDRKPQALAHGATQADEVTKLEVQHNVGNRADFAEHVAQMEAAGKRREMKAKNLPF